MNPLIFLVLVGGGYYYYKERKKKKAEEKALGPSCVLVTRHGSNLICEGTQCRGIAMAPGAELGDEFKAYWNDLFERHATAYYGSPPPWTATVKDAKDIIARGMAEAFPECSWRFLPDSTPMWGSTYAELALGFVATAPTLGGAAGGQGPSQLPGETSQDRNGMRLFRVGDVCSRVVLINEAAATQVWEPAMNAYIAANNPPATFEAAQTLLAALMSQFFPECPWPPTNPAFTFQMDGEVLTWQAQVIGMQLVLQGFMQGQMSMQPTPGNIGKLGQLALQQQGYA